MDNKPDTRRKVQSRMASIYDPIIGFLSPCFLNGRMIIILILILACLNIRANHFEMIYDMLTGAFINGLRRFIARRGTMKIIRCDRGTNFVGASRKLRQNFATTDMKKIGEEMLYRGIDWIYKPPQASHHGSSWE